MIRFGRHLERESDEPNDDVGSGMNADVFPTDVGMNRLPECRRPFHATELPHGRHFPAVPAWKMSRISMGWSARPNTSTSSNRPL